MAVVEVWWTPVEDDPSLGTERSWLGVLPADEAARVDRFRLAADRRRVAAAAGLTRLAAGHHLGAVEPKELRITRACRHCGHATHGKPRLDSGGLEFSASHGGGVAAVAVSTSVSVGLDIEPTTDSRRISRVMNLARSALTPEALAGCGPEPDLGLVLRHWTAKEAAGKECGLGILLDFPLTAVVGGDGSERCIATHLGLSWHISRPHVASGHLVALATAEPVTVQMRRVERPLA